MSGPVTPSSPHLPPAAAAVAAKNPLTTDRHIKGLKIPGDSKLYLDLTALPRRPSVKTKHYFGSLAEPWEYSIDNRYLRALDFLPRRNLQQVDMEFSGCASDLF